MQGISKPQGYLETITQDCGRRNLVLTSPNIASGETVTFITWVVSETPNNLGFCWLVQITLNPGQAPSSQQIVMLPGLGSI